LTHPSNGGRLSRGLVPAFAGDGERDLTLADLELARARAWLADLIERGLSPAIF
jgi:hypothetical protein